MRHLVLLWMGLAVVSPAKESVQTPIEPGFIEVRARVTLTASMK
jgi:hypothetical protein